MTRRASVVRGREAPPCEVGDWRWTCGCHEVSRMVMDGVEAITSVERRLRWSAVEKARLVGAMNEPGAVVTEVARGAGVEMNLPYR